MEKEMVRYEDLHRMQNEFFYKLFGKNGKEGLITLKELRGTILGRRSEDKIHDLPSNSLIEIPEKDDEFYEELENTYTSNVSYEGKKEGIMGCSLFSGTYQEEICNMASLMYLANIASKQYKKKKENEKDKEKRKLLNKEEKKCYQWKHNALTDIIASTFIYKELFEDCKDTLSYGYRDDDDGNPSFVIDVPIRGQLCVHFGWEENKNMILKNATEIVESVVEKRLNDKTITEEEGKRLLGNLKKEGILPEYEGKLYEYVGATPIEYYGDEVSKYHKMINEKIGEDITSRDLEILYFNGINERELHYLLVKFEASNSILYEVPKVFNISDRFKPQTIEDDTKDVTMSEFNDATQDIKNAVRQKNEKENPIHGTDQHGDEGVGEHG